MKNISEINIPIITFLDSFSEIAVVIVEDDGRIIFANKAFIKIAQVFNANSIINSYINELFDIPRENILNDIKKVIDASSSISNELLLKINNHSFGLKMMIDSVSFQDKTKAILSFINIQEYLDAKNLAAIVDHTEDHATIKDLDLRIVQANKSLINKSGLKDITEVVGKTDMELFGDTEHVRKYMEDDRSAQKLKKGEFIEREEFFILQNGEIINTLVKKFPVFDGHDKLIGTANISRNISYLKQIEEQLRESETNYKNLIENQGEGLGLIDKLGTFTFANKAAEEIFEVEQGKLIGRSIKEFISDSELNLFNNQIEIIAKGINTSFELKILINDTVQKYLIVTATPNTTKDNTPDGAFIILRDITARIYAEYALKKSEEKLQELNATKDKFFGIIAHDLKNPFGSIMGFSDMILRKLKEKDYKKIETWTRYIKKASLQGYELLENLLEWSRSQSGQLEILPEAVNLKELLKHNINVVEQIAQKKDISLKLNLDNDFEVFIDEDMINTVIRNLLTNAIKFSYKNSEIILNAKKKRYFAEVMIQDHGVGIRDEDLDKIFRMSESFSTEGTDHEEGTGLGLLLCKEFVEKNKGKIWVESEHSKGSTFKFTLPLKQK